MSRPRRRKDEHLHYAFLGLIFATIALCGYTLYTVYLIEVVAAEVRASVEGSPNHRRGPLSDSRIDWQHQ